MATIVDDESERHAFAPVDAFGRAVGSPARLATSFFAETPFSGQVNLLTTSSFDTPRQLFSGSNLARGAAFVRVGAPVGDQGDWMVRGAITEADLTAWLLAGSYTDAGASTAPVRIRHVVQHAALRRRQSADAARCLRWQPQRRNGLRRRHVRDQQGRDALVRRPLRPVPLPRTSHARQPALRVDAVARRSVARDDRRVEPGAGARRRRVPAAFRHRHLAATAANLLVARARRDAGRVAHDERLSGSRARHCGVRRSRSVRSGSAWTISS